MIVKGKSEKNSNTFTTDESGGDFEFGNREAFGDVGEGGSVHEAGDVITGVEKDASEAADGFLGAALVAGDGHAINGGQDAVEVADHFAHGDFGRTFRQKIAAANAGTAFDPALGLEGQHDLLEEAFRHIIAPGQFPDGNGRAAIMIHQGEQGAQGVIGSSGDSHFKYDRRSGALVNLC